MFAMLKLEQDSSRQRVISYPAGPERFAELLEIDGIFPAPYLARIHWVAAERWSVFRPAEWEQQLQAAYDLTLAKLPARTRSGLALPRSKQRLLIAERRKQQASHSPGDVLETSPHCKKVKPPLAKKNRFYG